ncbi:MAG TPA: hypothetical protein VE995_01550, partial [Gaiellaceae bacterium]|nr:hypothetical protein [Gaiellaceae bacterium]
MVTKALQLKPEPPSKHRPDVSPDLDRLVLRGLAQEPTERIRTARELAQELRRLVPPAASSEVAEWVDQIAGPVIVERAQRVAAIEQTLPSDVHATVPPPASEPQGTRKTGADGTVPTMTLGAIVRHFDASRVRYVALVTGALTALAVVLAMRARGAPAANRAGTDGGALASVPAPKLPAAGAGVEQQPLAPPAVPAPTAMPRTADVAADAGAAAAASPPRRAQPAAVRPSHPRADEFEHVMDSRK